MKIIIVLYTLKFYIAYMIDRLYVSSLLERLKHFPAVAIIGPRQCGKTTLAKLALPTWRYYDLERPSDFNPFESDPEGILSRIGERIIIDEAQRLPALFPVLRSTIDTRSAASGQYVFLGSASHLLMGSISESLAGRVSLLHMSPFLVPEISSIGKSIDHLWLRGGFPQPCLADNSTVWHQWYDGYTSALVERDLPLLGGEIAPALMRRLLLMLVHLNANLWNASTVANSLGVSYKTVNRYVDLLEQAGIVRRLLPLSANTGKRLVKTPKVMLRDSGMTHYLAGILSADALWVHPLRGASWEAFVIEQIIMRLSLQREGCRFWFWRTSGGAEVDLIVEYDGRYIPIEIKLSAAPRRNEIKGIHQCMNDLECPHGYIIFPGAEQYALTPSITAIPATRILNDPDQVLFERL